MYISEYYLCTVQFRHDSELIRIVWCTGRQNSGINGVICAARGGALNATLSMEAMIPFAGWASTGGKLALKGNDLNQVSKVVSTKKMESIYSPIYQDVVNSSLGKTQNQTDILSNTHYQLGTPKYLIRNRNGRLLGRKELNKHMKFLTASLVKLNLILVFRSDKGTFDK